MKRNLKIQMAILVALLFGIFTSTVYAQGVDTVLPGWLTWEAVGLYAAVGAFFGWLHDFNDGTPQILTPHKNANGTWDLGVITPALLGAVSGLIALAVQNTPALAGFFPTLNTTVYPGLLAAVFAGYFYTKTIQTISTLIYGPAPSTTTAPPAAAPKAPTPTTASTPTTTPDPLTTDASLGTYKNSQIYTKGGVLYVVPPNQFPININSFVATHRTLSLLQAAELFIDTVPMPPPLPTGTAPPT